MKIALTNQHSILKFIAFLEEGLPCVDAWTPTEINDGGCGVFALELAKELDKYEVPYTICALYQKMENGTPHEYINKKNEFKRNLKEVLSGDNTHLGDAQVSHMCIKINTIYVDSTGIINKKMHGYSDIIEVSKETVQLLVDKSTWNPIFDKSCTLTISRKLDEVFAKYKDFVEGSLVFPGKDDVHYTHHTTSELDKQNPFGNILNFLA